MESTPVSTSAAPTIGESYWAKWLRSVSYKTRPRDTTSHSPSTSRNLTAQLQQLPIRIPIRSTSSASAASACPLFHSAGTRLFNFQRAAQVTGPLGFLVKVRIDQSRCALLFCCWLVFFL